MSSVIISTMMEHYLGSGRWSMSEKQLEKQNLRENNLKQ
jgi:hypothetical protein